MTENLFPSTSFTVNDVPFSATDLLRKNRDSSALVSSTTRAIAHIFHLRNDGDPIHAQKQYARQAHPPNAKRVLGSPAYQQSIPLELL